jgi:hypothetical protein
MCDQARAKRAMGLSLNKFPEAELSLKRVWEIADSPSKIGSVSIHQRQIPTKLPWQDIESQLA